MSTHREIEEVYKGDIMRKQKMSKGVVAESLGEIQGERRLWVDMKFIERWTDKFDGFAQQGLIIDIDLIKQMLEEAGISIKKY